MNKNSIESKKKITFDTIQDKIQNKYNKFLIQNGNLNNSIINHSKKTKNKFQSMISKKKIKNSKISKNDSNRNNKSFENEMNSDGILTDDSICTNNISSILPSTNKKNSNDKLSRNTINLTNKKNEKDLIKDNKLNLFESFKNESKKNNKSSSNQKTNNFKLNNSTITNSYNQNQNKEENLNKSKIQNIRNHFETISYKEKDNECFITEKKVKNKISSLPNSTFQSKKNSKVKTKIIDVKNFLINNIIPSSNNSTSYTKKNEDNSFISNNIFDIKDNENNNNKDNFESFLESCIKNIEFDNLNNLDYEQFNQLKNDFNLFYTDEYLNNLQKDLIKLELELIIEKMFEIILTYHSKLNLIKNNLKHYKNIYYEFEEVFFSIEKKLKKLILLKEKKNLDNGNLNIISNNFLKENSIFLNINLNEFKIVKDIIPKKILMKKEKLKDIVLKILDNKNNSYLITEDKLKNWIKINKRKKSKIEIPKINIGAINISGNNLSIKSTTNREKKNKLGKTFINPTCKTQRNTKNIQNTQKKKIK